MGQKVNPHGFRVGVIRNWDSRWFAKDEVFGDTLVSDNKIRKYLKNKLKDAGVPKIEIERNNADQVSVFVHCAKPGRVVGKEGAEIEKLRAEVSAIAGKPVRLTVAEIKSPDLNAQLVAENVAAQLENRTAFRRAMKLCIGRTMKLGAKGIKIMCAGRLGGAEIARSETYHEGTIPLQTLRADIDYGFAEASTTYGKIGVKVWIYHGEVLSDNGKKRRFVEEIKTARMDRRDGRRGDRRDRRDGDRKGGDRRDNRGQNRGPRPQGGGNRAPRKEGGDK